MWQSLLMIGERSVSHQITSHFSPSVEETEARRSERVGVYRSRAASNRRRLRGGGERYLSATGPLGGGGPVWVYIEGFEASLSRWVGSEKEASDQLNPQEARLVACLGTLKARSLSDSNALSCKKVVSGAEIREGSRILASSALQYFDSLKEETSAQEV
uniref:Uncharacterized protein n=1 Tax=Steinernema glaseri TaxID=37863 RepID=A0A1I7YY21_9BILA